MISQVIKRNGKKVKFNNKKIQDAILKAALLVEDPVLDSTKELAFKISKDIENSSMSNSLEVEQINNIVENKLMASKRKDIAKAFINYRYLKNIARSQYDDLINLIREKLDAKNVQNQNANIDEHSFGGRMGEASSAVMKKIALDYIMSQTARDNHLNNEIYEHDLDQYAAGSHNCLSVPFDDLLKNGFKTRQVDIRGAKSVNTAMQLVAVIFQLQSLNQFGGVAATHLDWTMVPYVRMSFYKHYRDGLRYIEGKDLDSKLSNSLSIEEPMYKLYSEKAYQYALDMTEREVYQATEAMYHNLNSLQSRSGNQLPFTSLNYGTCTLPEGRMITKAILEVSIKGLGPHYTTSVFPCGIFQYMRGINNKPGTPNYDLFRLSLVSTSRRLYPNYCNVDWSVNAGYDRNDPTTYVSTMGCRTYNGFDINGMGFKKDGRGNICPVTIILPTLAMEAREFLKKEGISNPEEKQLVDRFIEILDNKIHEAKDMLLERFNWICSQSAASAPFMYENNTMTGYIPEEGIKSALKHGTLVIGQLGLAETLQILIHCDHTEEKGMEVAKRIEKLFNTRCAEFKKEWRGLESRPTADEITDSMVEIIKAQLGRSLTEEELKEIKTYTPAEKLC